LQWNSVVTTTLLLFASSTAIGDEGPTATQSVALHVSLPALEQPEAGCDPRFALWDSEFGGRRLAVPSQQRRRGDGSFELDFEWAEPSTVDRDDLWLGVATHCDDPNQLLSTYSRLRLVRAESTSHE